MYDYLIVGSGLFGSIFACEAKKRNRKCLVIDKRSHVGGNIYTAEVEGIQVHQYGAHIYHTSSKEEWEYMNQFAEFNRFTNSPVARYGTELYNLPFNMNTFNRMWGVITPEEARARLRQQIEEAGIIAPKNLEEQAISLVGRDIYEKLIRGYTEKQWGRKAAELPAFIIKRLPVRFTYDNNYFNDKYQGIPVGGYTRIIRRMLQDVEVRLGIDFLESRQELESIADKIIYTGMIDEYYDYCYGELEYRSLRFETEMLDCENFQGCAVVNYTEYEIPYTRIIEHKHFEFGCQNGSLNPRTVITKEYPAAWERGDEPYYPMNDDRNNELYAKYKELSEREEKVIFGGRLAMYRYFDMNNIVEAALKCVEREMPQ